MGSFLTRQELAALAGPHPADPAWHRKMKRAFRTWGHLRDELHDDPSIRGEIKSEMNLALRGHPHTWKVRGITHKALDALLGGDKCWTEAGRKGFERAHLHTWDGLIDELMQCHRDIDFTGWVQHVWELDVTIICTGRAENKALDSTSGGTRSFFDLSVTTFRNDSNLFCDSGTRFKLRKKTERPFLTSISKKVCATTCS